MNKKIRIISGKFGGLFIDTPKGHRTHPMSEKLRSALFNSLGEISDLAVLDLYAGSGAIGIEALSREAKACTFIDNDPNALNCLRQNLKQLKLTQSSLVKPMSIYNWLSNPDTENYDIIIADPPYDKINSTELQQIIQRYKQHSIIIMSLPASYDLSVFQDKPPFKAKTYGNAQLIYFKPQ